MRVETALGPGCLCGRITEDGGRAKAGLAEALYTWNMEPNQRVEKALRRNTCLNKLLFFLMKMQPRLGLF